MNYRKNRAKALYLVFGGLFVAFAGSLKAASTSLVPKSSSSSSSTTPALRSLGQVGSAFAQTVSDASASLMRHSLVLKGAPQGRRHSEPNLSSLPMLMPKALHPLDAPSSPELERKVQASHDHPAVLLAEDRKREAAQTPAVNTVPEIDAQESILAPKVNYINMECVVCTGPICVKEGDNEDDGSPKDKDGRNLTVRACGHFMHTDPCFIKTIAGRTKCLGCQAELSAEALEAINGLRTVAPYGALGGPDRVPELEDHIAHLEANTLFGRFLRLRNYMQNNTRARYLMYAGTLASMVGMRKGIKSDIGYSASASILAGLSAAVGTSHLTNRHEAVKKYSLFWAGHSYIYDINEKGLVEVSKSLRINIFNAGAALLIYGFGRGFWSALDRFQPQRV